MVEGARRQPGFHHQPGPLPGRAVLENPRAAVRGGDHQVEVAVRVQIPGRQAAADNGDLAEFGRQCPGVSEAVAVAAEDQGRLRVLLEEWRTWRFPGGTGYPPISDHRIEDPVVVEISQGDAEPGHAEAERPQSEVDRAVHEADSRFRQIDGIRLVGEVREQDVEDAVAAEIPYLHSHSGLRTAETAERGAEQQGLFPEGPVALVHPQVIRLGVVRHVEVRPSVAREVLANDSQAPGRQSRDPGLASDFHERAVATVAVEEIRQAGYVGRVAVVLLTGGREA